MQIFLIVKDKMSNYLFVNKKKSFKLALEFSCKKENPTLELKQKIYNL